LPKKQDVEVPSLYHREEWVLRKSLLLRVWTNRNQKEKSPSKVSVPVNKKGKVKDLKPSTGEGAPLWGVLH